MATLVTTPIKTFISGETVTPAKLNELGQSTVALTAGTIVDADISASAGIALSKLATGALPTAITTTTANIVDASVTPAKLSQPPTLATAQASTSGTSIDFTGIPSWARRITVIFSGVSTSGTSLLAIQLGTSGGLKTSGYVSYAGYYTGAGGAVSSVTNGFGWHHGSNTDVEHGAMTIMNAGGNLWVSSHSGGYTSGAANFMQAGGGSVTMSGAVDRLRITTVGGTNTFDAGTINISYEG